MDRRSPSSFTLALRRRVRPMTPPASHIRRGREKGVTDRRRRMRQGNRHIIGHRPPSTPRFTDSTVRRFPSMPQSSPSESRTNALQANLEPLKSIPRPPFCARINIDLKYGTFGTTIDNKISRYSIPY